MLTCRNSCPTYKEPTARGVSQLITGISGGILFIAVILYFTVLFGTLLARKTLDDAQVPSIPFVDAVHLRREGTLKFPDSLSV